MIEIVPFKTDHGLQMSYLFQSSMNISSFLNNDLEKIGLSYTMLEDGKAIISGGVIPLWSGVGEAWTLISPRACKLPILMHKTVKRYLNMFLSQETFHRLQCLVELNHDAGHRWAKRLGFKEEGTMKMFSSDKRDYMRYSIIKG